MYGFNNPNGMQMGVDMSQWGQGVVSQPAAVPMRGTAPGMDFGRGITGAQGMMPPTGGPGAAAGGPAGGKMGNFLGNFGNLAEGLAGLGQLYIGLKSLGIAKDQLAFSKEAYSTNLANQKKSYNTALEDRIRSRYVTEGRNAGEADAYLSKNNL